jgi:CDP-glucose 4,6-dehydratase
VNDAPQTWSESRALVTGATGMVGSWLVKRLLERGTQVAALVRDNDPHSEVVRSGDIQRISVVNGALEDYTTVERAIVEHDIDTVFHLGAQTIVGIALRSPLHTFESNIRGTYNVLEACRRHADVVRRIVIASSDKAYGEHEHLPYTEDAALLAKHPYDVSKSCGDLIAQSYFHTYSLPVVTARCGNIYGGGDLNWSRVVPGTLRSVLRGERPVIRSDGKFVRDYLYVRDAVEAYLLLAEKCGEAGVAGEAFNFSTETPLTVLEVVERVQTLTGTEHLAPIILDQARAEIHSQHLSAAKARERLGWTAAFDLTAGLSETRDWYAAFLGVEA